MRKSKGIKENAGAFLRQRTVLSQKGVFVSSGEETKDIIKQKGA